MTKIVRILAAVVLVLVIAAGAFAFVLQYDSSCDSAPTIAVQSGETMRAIEHRCYGGLEVLHLASVAKPTPGDDEILVKVHAAGLNPHDTHLMRGTPYIVRMQSGIGAPTSSRLGTDFSGVVEAVGKNVKRFRPGDAVFGGAEGSFADYVVVNEAGAVAPKPAEVTFEQAASLPIAAVSALQALRDRGGVQPGQKVLINGASGGVGTYAVQIAKLLGAEVTGVCSTRNVDMVRMLGADHVIDYTKADFTRSDARYDVIVDNVVNHSLEDYRRVLAPQARVVVVGVSSARWLGPLNLPMQQKLLAPFSDHKFILFLAQLNATDLGYLGDLVKAKKIIPTIDRGYPLADFSDAVKYLETARARGKVIIRIDDSLQ